MVSLGWTLLALGGLAAAPARAPRLPALPRALPAARVSLATLAPRSAIRPAVSAHWREPDAADSLFDGRAPARPGQPTIPEDELEREIGIPRARRPSLRALGPRKRATP